MDIYYEHSLYGDKVNQSFLDIHSFLQDHQKEVVILDFNRFTAMSPEAHHRLISLIRTYFGSMIHPRCTFQELSLSKMWETNKRVIVFYRDGVGKQSADLWPGEKIISPWLNDDDTEKLLSFVEAGRSRGLPEESFYVTQCVITPSPNMIMGHMSTSLQLHVGGKVASRVTDWLQSKPDMNKTINICIADFVELSNFIDVVIGLNTSRK